VGDVPSAALEMKADRESPASSATSDASEMRIRNVASSALIILACVLAAAIVGGLILLHSS
jgi:hypothetical protein